MHKIKIREHQKKAIQRGCIITALAVYFAALLAAGYLLRSASADYQVQVIPFVEYFSGKFSPVLILTAALKLCLFIPVGILFTVQLQEEERLVRAAMFSFGMGLFLETVQYIGGMGDFLTGDMLLAVLGGVLGALAVIAWKITAGRRSAGGILLRIAAALGAICIFLAATAFGTFHFLRISGAKSMRQNVSSAPLNMESRNPDGRKGSDSQYIWHDGKAYRFNDEIISILCMGIDRSGEEQKASEASNISGRSGQADTIFLAVMDPVRSQLKLIAISRDTMTEIPAFDSKGNYLGENVNHLGLAFAYGDGKEKSCHYMVDAVSKLFYGIPINGYAAFNLDTIGPLNDAVGGVTVTVPEGEDMTSANPALKSGAEVTLDGGMAETFVRWRDTELHGSNDMRIARQKQFVLGFFGQAVTALQKDVSLPVTLYQEFAKDMVTDIDLEKAVYLVSEAVKMTFPEGNLMTLQGEAKTGEVYDEFYADDDALYQLILDTFYIEETGS